MPQNTAQGEVELIPLCAHRASPDGKYDALVLRYIEKDGGVLEVVTEGKIGTAENQIPFFAGGGSIPALQIGDRVIYNYPVQNEEGTLRGTLDNAAGMAACLAAFKTIMEIAEEVKISFEDLGLSVVFTDEEEGVPASNATFARGMRRFLRNKETAHPRLMINVDGHDTETSNHGALYASAVSKGKGIIVPPQLYVPFEDFMHGLKQQYCVNNTATELAGSVSRSDDVAMMEVSPNVLICGYATQNPHFNTDIPTANLSDLVHLSKAIVWTALEFRPSSIFRT